MKTQSVEKMLQIQLMTQMMKKTLGNSLAFDMVLESVTKAMEEDNGGGLFGSLGLEEEDLTRLGYGGGQILDSKNKTMTTLMTTSISKELKSNNISIDEAIKRASSKYGIDEKLIRSIIKQESDFNPNSKSWAGAMGLMQLMPENVREDGVTNPYDINQNIDAGTRQFSRYLKQYNNSKEMALAAYNAGPGTLARRGVNSTDKIDRLPSETRNYVKKVMGYYGK